MLINGTGPLQRCDRDTGCFIAHLHAVDCAVLTELRQMRLWLLSVPIFLYIPDWARYWAAVRSRTSRLLHPAPPQIPHNACFTSFPVCTDSYGHAHTPQGPYQRRISHMRNSPDCYIQFQHSTDVCSQSTVVCSQSPYC